MFELVQWENSIISGRCMLWGWLQGARVQTINYKQMMVTSAAISQQRTLSLTRDRTQCYRILDPRAAEATSS